MFDSCGSESAMVRCEPRLSALQRQLGPKQATRTSNQIPLAFAITAIGKAL